jgi:hypothetical protein
MLCSICFNKIPRHNGRYSDNNAQPINYGRCCNDCNSAIVIPACINILKHKIADTTLTNMHREQFKRLSQVMIDTSDLSLTDK